MSIAWENVTTRQETQQFSADTTINSKIKLAVAGLQPSIQKLILEFPSERDKELVADFLLSRIKQENITVGTKRVYLMALAYLSRHHFKNKISLEAMTARDLSDYLINSLQKDRAKDPDQSWISTQRTYGRPIQKFFKWLAFPDMTPQERKFLPHDKLPPVLKGLVLQTKKGSKTPVKAKHIWNDKDVALFLKYCKDNPRLRFYHALAMETSGRPGELLPLKIGDVKIESDSAGKLYAALDIGRYGKKKESRITGITEFSIQYFQVYLPYHPDPTNKGAFIFASKEHSAYYSPSLPISSDALRSDYIAYRDKLIPKLLKRPDVSDTDKEHLLMLKEQKKWNPYTMRHSSLTKLARDPNINDYTLRQHAGWSKRSNMIEIYTHELKGDSLEHVMLAYGVNLKDKRDNNKA
jgi:integrase/recombinase XerD